MNKVLNFRLALSEYKKFVAAMVQGDGRPGFEVCKWFQTF
jgi:hypothetical protein